MLEQPAVADGAIAAVLQPAYGVSVARIEFLPLGADLNTAVYRVIADDETPYFLKLRSGLFDETSVAVPKFLSDCRVGQIIAPLPTQSGALWASWDACTLILYPYVEGRNGFAVELSDRQWAEFGAALRQIHAAVVPPVLAERIQRERYSSHWRVQLRTFLAHLAVLPLVDPEAAALAEFLTAKRAQVLALVERTDRLAQRLKTRPPAVVLCHSDIHAGNLLIDGRGALFIVDWDNPILAPKERDLMFIGGGQGFGGHTAEEEERLFYCGYGQPAIDPVALAYYRYERIIQDIEIYCEQLLLTTAGGADRKQALHFLMSNFLPNGALAQAYRSDPLR